MGQQHIPAEPLPTPPSTVKDDIRDYQKLEGRWVLDNTYGNPDNNKIEMAIKANHLCIISNGSYKNGLSTAACVLTDKSQSFQLKIRSFIPGHADIQDSELGSLYSALVIVHLLQLIYRIPPAMIEIACNGLQALINAFSNRPLDPS
jgi:hypothetical protein